MSSVPASFGSSLRVAWKRHGSRVLMAGLASATLGLAPFYPHAHVWKQLVSLAHGTLTQPLDVFDLLLHGAPWIALLIVSSQMFISAAVDSTARRGTP